jgi:hypothetical protein
MARRVRWLRARGYPECGLVVGDPAGDGDFRAGGGVSHVAYAETTPCGG